MSNRGGARPGTGPKPTGRRKVNVYVTEYEEIIIRSMLELLRDGQDFTASQLLEIGQIKMDWKTFE
jgi:transcription-repair coupling factor (superfamily II helicase)